MNEITEKFIQFCNDKSMFSFPLTDEIEKITERGRESPLRKLWEYVNTKDRKEAQRLYTGDENREFLFSVKDIKRIVYKKAIIFEQ